MGVLLAVSGWLLGVFLTVQVIAAFYSIVDFQEQLGRRVWTIVSRIGGWLLAMMLVQLLDSVAFLAAFHFGATFMLAAHVLGLFVPNLGIVLFKKREAQEYRDFLERLDKQS